MEFSIEFSCVTQYKSVYFTQTQSLSYNIESRKYRKNWKKIMDKYRKIMT